jgi:cell division protein FtsW
MGRSRSTRTLEPAAVAVGGLREHQTTIFERLDQLTRRAEVVDASRPAGALFCIVLALSSIGFLIQASHAATALEPADFFDQLLAQAWFRVGGIAVLILGARIGPSGLRRFIPALVVVMAAMLIAVFLPVVGSSVNGSHRWLRLGPLSFQPSELARIVVVLWLADRCVRLGPLVCEFKRGVLPMLALGLVFFGLVAVETDLGGAILLLLCIFATMWVGGARPKHVFAMLPLIGTAALGVAFEVIPYIRRRIEMFLGHAHNQQVGDSLAAIANGNFFGVGLGEGLARNQGVPYLESDFVFAQIGEELGLFGMLLVLVLLGAFLWYALRLVLSIRDRYDALASFGLLVSTGLQSMLHVQVVAGLAPPKGMTLPFISHGGTSLVVSSLAVGLAIGAARRSSLPRSELVGPLQLSPQI